MKRFPSRLAWAAAVFIPCVSVGAQPARPVARTAARPAAIAPLAAPFDTGALSAIKWREVGPYRGGRSAAVAGSVARPNEYWMGTVGSGVFKTVDGGNTWAPMSDKYFGGTIGGIAVAPSRPDVVYVGGGEFTIRGNVSHGDGVWKTTDGGKTWVNIGLNDTRQISRVLVHPTNPDLAYVAAQFEVTDTLLSTLRELTSARDYARLLEGLMWSAAFHADARSFEAGLRNDAGRGALERRMAHKGRDRQLRHARVARHHRTVRRAREHDACRLWRVLENTNCRSRLDEDALRAQGAKHQLAQLVVAHRREERHRALARAD